MGKGPFIGQGRLRGERWAWEQKFIWGHVKSEGSDGWLEQDIIQWGMSSRAWDIRTLEVSGKEKALKK